LKTTGLNDIYQLKFPGVEFHEEVVDSLQLLLVQLLDVLGMLQLLLSTFDLRRIN
jgi:hypothetical protein